MYWNCLLGVGNQTYAGEQSNSLFKLGGAEHAAPVKALDAPRAVAAEDDDVALVAARAGERVGDAVVERERGDARAVEHPASFRKIGFWVVVFKETHR